MKSNRLATLSSESSERMRNNLFLRGNYFCSKETSHFNSVKVWITGCDVISLVFMLCWACARFGYGMLCVRIQNGVLKFEFECSILVIYRIILHGVR